MGATQGSIDNIQRMSYWGPSEIGLLGAMDKIGMTVSATVWGILLAKIEARPLLVMGLGVNWMATLMFAILTNHWSMQVMKLLMGFTEGLQWVWSQAWIINKTDGDPWQLTFISLSSSSAALGNLFGTMIAGYGTANGLSYEFAFKLEAAGLVVFWICVLTVKTSDLAIRKDQDDYRRKPSGYLNAEPPQEPSTFASTAVFTRATSELSIQLVPSPSKLPLSVKLKKLFKNKLFRYSALAFAMLQYVAAAFAFQWIRLFMGLWRMSKVEATTGLILLPGLSGAIGMVCGACFVVDSPLARRRTLRNLVLCQAVEVFFSIVALVGLLLQVQLRLQQELEGDADSMDMTPAARTHLWITYGGLFIGISMAATCQASLQAIASQNDVIGDEGLQTLAVGVQQCLTNFVGFAMGPLFPQLMMSLVSSILGCHAGDVRIVFVGGAGGIAGTIVAAIFIAFAFRAAHPQQIECIDGDGNGNAHCGQEGS